MVKLSYLLFSMRHFHHLRHLRHHNLLRRNHTTAALGDELVDCDLTDCEVLKEGFVDVFGENN
jgi:hypothetical protein